ncbi:MAG: hypothetical protein LAO04_14430, partial [Acidobacteriia bacterium]|nr:hypothetical protein [Terriglobia bacterium]
MENSIIAFVSRLIGHRRAAATLVALALAFARARATRARRGARIRDASVGRDDELAELVGARVRRGVGPDAAVA